MSLPVGRQVTETDKRRESGRWSGSVAALVTGSITVGSESPIYRSGWTFSVLTEPLMGDPFPPLQRVVLISIVVA